MSKKIILAALLISFTGILIWGGINRTLAKTNEGDPRNANNQNIEHIESTEGNGAQLRGNGYQGRGNDAQTEWHDSEFQTDAIAQGQSNGNGFQVDLAKENTATPLDGIGNSYGANGENQALGKSNGSRGGRGNGNGNGQGGGSDPLTVSEMEALNLALDDEYHALAVYQSVIAALVNCCLR